MRRRRLREGGLGKDGQNGSGNEVLLHDQSHCKWLDQRRREPVCLSLSGIGVVDCRLTREVQGNSYIPQPSWRGAKPDAGHGASAAI